MNYFKKLLLSLSLLLLLSSPCFSATEFVSAINKTGEDYNTLTLWEAAMDDAGDITASDVKVFAHGGITGTVADLDSVTGQTSGATGTVIHATSTQILIDAISGTFTSGEEVRVTVGNSVTISDAGDSPIIVAEVYDDDGDLVTNVLVDGTTTNSTNYFKITAPVAERHDGTAGSGVILKGDGSTHVYALSLDDKYAIVEWLEITGYDKANSSLQAIFMGTGMNAIVRNNLIYDICQVAVNCTGTGINFRRENKVLNNIIYNVSGSGISEYAGWGTHIKIFNNTVYNFNTKVGGTSKGINVTTNNSVNCEVKNNIVVEVTDTGSDYTLGADCVNTNNASSDSTATGTNSITTASTSDFVSTTASSEDLHLASGAVGIDQGTDLGTANGINFDIDNRDRDVEGDTWDIGADEYVSVGGGGRTRRMFITN